MDALDSLYIMEMYDEFDAATDWVEKNLDFNLVRKCYQSTDCCHLSNLDVPVNSVSHHQTPWSCSLGVSVFKQQPTAAHDNGTRHT